MFRNQDGFIVNEKGKVVAVDGGLDNENRNIIVEQKNGRVSQRW
jgi:predicted transcriptional regulator